MLIPAPDRRRHFPEEYQRRARPERTDNNDDWRAPDTSRFDRADEVVSRFNAAIRKVAERELAAVTRKLEEPEERAAETTDEPSTEEPRRIVAEERGDDGSVTRFYSNGDVLTRTGNTITGTWNGVEVRMTDDAAQVRVYSGQGANTLR